MTKPQNRGWWTRLLHRPGWLIAGGLFVAHGGVGAVWLAVLSHAAVGGGMKLVGGWDLTSSDLKEMYWEMNG